MALRFEQGQPVAKAPYWDWFNTAILVDPTYQQITQLTPDKLLVSRVESFALQAIEVSLLKYQWDALITSVSADFISVDVVARWNSYADNFHMPFTFDKNGIMSLRDN
ncbi:MAG: hypothetical protein AAFW84_21375 [Cyanobacteria bacterium J06635_15]